LIPSIPLFEKGATMQFKKIVTILLLCSAASVLFIACGGTGTTIGTTPTPTIESTKGTVGNSTDVHMSYQAFAQSTVTIRKGSSITLVDDVAVLHILANGSWQNGVPKSEQEPGAPTVKNVQVNGSSVELGPFVTAGTYHIYCTVHPGMTLTIIVQ
jgi:plastocyanin